MIKKYSSYQETSIDWIGSIPSDWNLKRVGQFFLERSEKVDDKSFPPLSVTKFGIVDQLKEVAKTNDGDNRKLVKKNDFVINSRSDRKGSSGIAKRDGSVSLINIVLEPILIEPKFIEYLFKSYYFKEEFFRNGKGIHWDLWTTRWEQFKNINIPIPSKLEQKNISQYLDKKTKKIDSLVEKIEKKIELLKEQKTALINQYITKGIDPNIEMKDSGVEWIGEIPKNWEVKKLKYLLDKIIDNRGRTPEYSSKGIPMLEIPNITRGLKKPDLNFKKFVKPELVNQYERNKVNVGDVLISTVGATSGEVVIIEDEPKFFICQNIVGLRSKKIIKSEFLYYFLKSNYFKYSLELINKSNTIDNLKVSVFINITCFVPPIDEQIKITSLIEKLVLSNEKKIQLNTKKIKLLKEYRQSLISSVVTGKIRITEDII